MLEKAEHIQEPQEPMVTLREYIYGQIFYEIEPEKQIICCPIQVEQDSSLIKKSIKNSGFRPKYRGYILGIERGMLPIVNPDIDMVIEEGDLLWVIGTQKMANSLLNKFRPIHTPAKRNKFAGVLKLVCEINKYML